MIKFKIKFAKRLKSFLQTIAKLEKKLDFFCRFSDYKVCFDIKRLSGA